jgi:hypothetical protein
MVFCENKRLNLELESSFSKIASLRSMHDDMSAKPCDNCKMIMINYADMWLVHSRVASLLDSARLELRELKARSTLLGACTTCPLVRFDLEASAIEIKDLKYKLNHSSRYTVLSPPCEACVSLKGKLFHATKENTELQQEVAYLTTHLEKTILSEKMIEEDLSRVEECATKSTYKLGIGFKRCEKRMRRVLQSLFLAPATIKTRKHSNQPKLTTHPTQREKQGKKLPSRERKLLFACSVAVLVTWMSFASGVRELRGGVLSMLETHIVMSLLIFRLVLILMFRLALTLMLCLISPMDLTIAHMVLVHERTALILDASVMAHVLIVVIVSRVGLVFLLEGPTPTLSRETWMVHIFSIVVHIPLGQVVRCKGL